MKKAPSKAMILCAGLGTRMLPLTKSVPKPLLPVWGETILDRTINMLQEWGVQEILINMHHRPDKVFRHITTRQGKHPSISLSYEPEILGTGGALKQASWFFDSSPIWIVNGDILAKLDPLEMIKAYNKKNILAATWLTDERGPRTVRTENGIITNFHDNAPCSPGTYTFCGLQLVSPQILEYLDKEDFSSIISAYKRSMRSGHRIAGVSVKGSFWADMGTPEAYLDAHDRVYRSSMRRKGNIKINYETLKSEKTLSKAGVKTSGFACIDKKVSLKRGANIHNSVIMGNASLGKNAKINDALVAHDTTANGKATGIVVPYSFVKSKIMDYCIRSLGFKESDVVIQAFEARGSQRSFYRVSNRDKSVIVVQYDPSRKENSLAVRHTRFLKSLGVNVPAVINDFPSRCLSVFEDAGDRSLLNIVKQESSENEIIKHYMKVLDNIFIMHKNGTQKAKSRRMPISHPFTPKLYRWERELFGHFFLDQRFKTKKSLQSSILNDIAVISAKLNKCSKVLLHRDLQSTNVIFKKHKPYLIDYQGMRLGPAVYDLASLLCDPYVMLKQSTRSSILEHYAELSRTPYDSLEEIFWAGAIQRLIQALGAFGRLASHGPTARFASHIPNGMIMLNTALQHVSGLDNLKLFTNSYIKTNNLERK